MDKEFLKFQFESPESIGLYWGNLRGEPVTDSQDGFTTKYLSSGDDIAESVKCACYVANKLKGKAEVYGFLRGDNPIVSNPNILEENQHYFAVVEKRFIVDIWLFHNKGECGLVYDLDDSKDRVDIITRYGNPRLWSWLSHSGMITPYSQKYPIEKRVQIAKREPENKMSLEHS